MDWKNVTFDWNQARAVLATAEQGSLSAAAAALGQTQPTLSRQVAAFETALKVTVFERVGRGLTLTPAGAELINHLQDMRDAALGLSLAASGQSQDLEGEVRITGSDVYAAMILPDILTQLRRVAPNLIIDVVADNQIQDLQRREADIAIRHVRPEQPELIARLIGHASGSFYAHQSYLDRHGIPRTVEELSACDFIGLADVDRMIDYFKPLGIHVTANQFKARSANGVVAWELAKAGLGVLPMSDLVAQDCPGMVRLMPDLKMLSFPFWLTTHRELHTSARIRIVFDHLADALRSYVN